MPVAAKEAEVAPAADSGDAGGIQAAAKSVNQAAAKSVNQAAAPPDLPAGSADELVCCVCIQSTDKLRMIGMPEEYWDDLRRVLETAWPPGIQREKWVDAAREVKLNGNPWDGEGEDSIQCRRLVVALVGFLESRGWVLEAASCLNRKSASKDSLLFRRPSDKASENAPPAKADSGGKPDICSVSFSMNDRVRVIDVPASVADAIKDVIQSEWRHGMEKERWFNGVPEYKLNGSPWNAEGDETVQANFLVSKLMRALRAIGWKVHASVGITNGKEGRDLDTWILKRITP